MTIQKYSTVNTADRRLQIYEVDVTFLCDGSDPDSDVCTESALEDNGMEDCQLEEKRGCKYQDILYSFFPNIIGRYKICSGYK